MITETNLNGLTNVPKKYKKYHPPQPLNPNLPPLWHCLMAVSQKGAGKTFSVVNLLQNYTDTGIVDNDGHRLIPRIIYCSPTAGSAQNSILTTLKYLDKDDIYEEVTEGTLKDIFEDLVAEKNEITIFEKYVKAYNRFQKLKNPMSLTDEEIFTLSQYDFRDPKELEPEYERPRVVFWILDDLIGSSNVFKTTKNSFINWLTIRHRHDSSKTCPVNLHFISQNLKSINPIIRKQIDLWVLFKNSNRRKLIEQLWEEVSGAVSIEDFEKYYDYVCNIDFGSLIISVHTNEKKENRVRCGWDKALRIS